MTGMDSIVATVIGSILAMGGLLVVATMMEQWMKSDPLAQRGAVEGQSAVVSTTVSDFAVGDLTEQHAA